MKKLLNMNEVADLLAIKLSGLRALVFRRDIPVLKVGRRVRFDPDELQQWICQKREGGKAPKK